MLTAILILITILLAVALTMALTANHSVRDECAHYKDWCEWQRERMSDLHQRVAQVEKENDDLYADTKVMQQVANMYKAEAILNQELAKA